MLQKGERFRCASQIFILKSYLHEVCQELDTHQHSCLFLRNDLQEETTHLTNFKEVLNYWKLTGSQHISTSSAWAELCKHRPTPQYQQEGRAWAAATPVPPALPKKRQSIIPPFVVHPVWSQARSLTGCPQCTPSTGELSPLAWCRAEPLKIVYHLHELRKGFNITCPAVVCVEKM